MQHDAKRTVLVLTDRPAFGKRCDAVLADLADCLPWDPALLADRTPDLVIAADPASFDRLKVSLPELLRHHTGIVAIGPAADSELSADVCLPEDASDRELRLACELLGRVVDLRRQCCAEAEDRQKLARLALTDPLTSLPNRRAWDEALQSRARSVLGGEQTLCLALLDLDHFKPVNDTFGHPVGDSVLRAAARAMVEHLRQTDLVARLGGDEFGLLLATATPEAAAQVVERVRAGVTAQLAAVAPRPVTVSAGYCCQTPLPPDSTATPLPWDRIDELVAAADTALHAAKRAGRNCTRAGRINPRSVA